MNTKIPAKTTARFVACVIALVALLAHLATSSAIAAAYYWDCDDITAGFGTAQGTWSVPTVGATNFGWTTSTTGVNVVSNVSVTTLIGDTINFGNGATGLGAGTIAVSGTVSNANMTFAVGSGAITLSGGTIRLQSPVTITVNNLNVTNTITSVLAGAAGALTKSGAGTLYLSAANTYTATNTIIGGNSVLVLNNVNAIPSTSGMTLSAGFLGLGAGNFTNAQGNISASVASPGKVQWQNNGGFAAYGAERTVNMGGAGGFLGFGSGNVKTVIGTMNGKTLWLGAADSTHKLIWANGLDVGGGTRTVQVNDGLAAVDAEIRAEVAGAAGAGLTKTGTGKLLMSGTNTYTGPTTITGTLQIGAAGRLGSGSYAAAVSIAAASALLQYSSSADQTLGGAISGTGSLVKDTSSSTLILSGVNNYSGGTTNSAGTLQMDSTTALGTGPLTLSGGTLSNNVTATLANDVNLSSAATIGVASTKTLTLSGMVTGSDALTKTGAGTLKLTGSTVSYSGTTTVSAGKLVVPATATANAAVTVSANATLGVTASGANQWQPASLALGSPCTLEFNNVQNPNTTTAPLNPAAAVTSTATTVNVKNLLGTPAVADSYPLLGNVSSTNGYTLGVQPIGVTGQLAVNLGTLVYVVNTIPDLWAGTDGTNPTYWDIGTTVNWAGGATGGKYTNGDHVFFDDTASSTTVSVQVPVAPSSMSFNNSVTYTVSASAGNVIGGGGGLNLIGTGTVVLAGGAHTYIGATAINSGTLQLGDGASGNDATIAGTSGVTDDGALVFNRFGSSTAAYVISGTGTVTKQGAGTQILTANNTYSGGTTISGGALQLGDGAVNNGSVAGTIVNDASLVVANPNPQTVANPISGTGSVTKSAAGLLTLSGVNAFSGGVNINTGTLALGNGAALGATSANTVIAAGATLDLNGFAGATNNPVVVSGGGTTGTNAITSSAAIASPFVGLRFVTLTGDTVLNAATRWDIGLGTAGGTFTGAGYKLTVCGTNDMSLNYLGDTDLGDVVVSNRTLFIQGSTTLGRTTNTVYVYPGSTLNLFGATVNVNKPLALNGGTLADGSSTPTYSGPISVNANSAVSAVATFNLSGVISGAGGLTFTGGTNLLTATNNYSGSTFVGSGILRAGVASDSVSGPFGVNSAVTISNVASATLDLNNFDVSIGSLTGGGTTGGKVTLGAGTLTVGGNNTSPAAFAGVISGTGGLIKIGGGTLALSGTSTYNGTTTVSNGTLTLTGRLTGGGAVTLNDGATLNVRGQGTNSAIASLGDLTLGSSGACTLGLSNLSNTNVALVNANNVLVNGTVTLQISGSMGTGVFPLVKYATSLSGAGSIALSLPPGTSATLVTNILNQSLDLDVTYAPVSIVTNLPAATGYRFPGASYSLTVAATGSPTLSYSWNRNATPVGTDSPTLILTNLGVGDSGGYSVTVTNATSSAQSSTNQLVVLTPSTYESLVLASGPLAFWPLNEPAGPIAQDYVTYSNYNGTYSGAGVTYSVAGPASDTVVTLDGVSGTVTVPYAAALNPSAFSVELWVKPAQVPRAIGYVASSVQVSGNRSGWYMAQDDGATFAAGSAFVVRMFNTNGSTESIQLSTPITDTNWYHLVLTHDGTTASLYANGVLATNGTAPFVPNVSAPFTVGMRSDAALKWPGSVGGVALYSRALTSTEVAQHSLNAPVAPSPSLLTNSVSGGVLSLSWPAGQNWRLQEQTNALSVGLRTNWVYVTDSSVSSTNIPVDKTKPTTFYRLVYP